MRYKRTKKAQKLVNKVVKAVQQSYERMDHYTPQQIYMDEWRKKHQFTPEDRVRLEKRWQKRIKNNSKK